MEKNEVIISAGSNINPETNIRMARAELEKIAEMVGQSAFIYTKPLHFREQPDFLNGAFLIRTQYNPELLKQELRKIEEKLGRTRTENKNGPRTIDLDIVVFNNTITNPDFFERDFLRKAVFELIPVLEKELRKSGYRF